VVGKLAWIPLLASFGRRLAEHVLRARDRLLDGGEALARERSQRRTTAGAGGWVRQFFPRILARVGWAFCDLAAPSCDARARLVSVRVKTHYL
jgi:hypothetical protein